MSLFSRLFGKPAPTPDAGSPVEQWQGRLAQARELQEQFRYREAAGLLADLLIDMRSLEGTAVDAYLPVVLGSLGESYFQNGEAARAVAPTQQALEIVRGTNDREAERVSLGNLYECHRYLEQPEPAARCAEQLADLLEQASDAEQARRYRQQARLVRAGEPRNRVVVEIDGQRYEVDEVLQGVEGRVRFHFERNKLTLRPAEVLVGQGEREGGQGRYEEALTLLGEAARADPLAPQPAYQAGVTLLHLGRAAEAALEYERTEELAPGWFHCRSEGWLAHQIALGRYPHEVFLLVRIVEDGRLAPHARRQRVRQGFELAPDLALFYESDGKALAEAGQHQAAERAYRDGLDCAEEPDVRTRLLVALAGLLEPGAERRRLFDEAIALNGNLVAVATARIVLNFD